MALAQDGRPIPMPLALLFAASFYAATAVFVVSGLIASLFGLSYALRVVMAWTETHRWLADRLLGIRSQVEGSMPAGPHLVAVKHQSMFETLEMARLAHAPIIVIKRELADIPFFGWMTRRYGIIAVDRRAGAKALRDLVARGREAVDSGRSVLIFPEGTRLPPGEMPPLQSGFAGLYRALGLPVVPVAMDSGRLFGRSLPRHSGTVTFRIGETIPPGLARAEIEARVHAAINAIEMAPGERASAAQPSP